MVVTAIVVVFSFFPTFPAAAETSALPRPDHIVIVIEENHSYSEIIESPVAPYINSLARQGALLTQSFGVTHPSLPNYLALFSGSTQGVLDDSCPHAFSTPNLASKLIQAGLNFKGYSEDLPLAGSTVCYTNGFVYVRKHNPWVNWQESSVNTVPAQHNVPFTSFPTDFTKLPTVSIVVPNQYNDMHETNDVRWIQRADVWLRQNIASYVQWAMTNNSLFIVTFDEDDQTEANRIATIFVGPMVTPGKYDTKINHYNVLRTIEDIYSLPYGANSANAKPITEIWAPKGKDRRLGLDNK